jgi:hypothetical protein
VVVVGRKGIWKLIELDRSIAEQRQVRGPVPPAGPSGGMVSCSSYHAIVEYRRDVLCIIAVLLHGVLPALTVPWFAFVLPPMVQKDLQALRSELDRGVLDLGRIQGCLDLVSRDQNPAAAEPGEVTKAREVLRAAEDLVRLLQPLYDAYDKAPKENR